LTLTYVVVQPRKRGPALPVTDLSPIKASPNASPLPSATAKENISTFNRLANVVNADKKKNPRSENAPNGLKDKYPSRKAQQEKENSGNISVTSSRRPFGALAQYDSNIPRAVASTLHKKPSGNTHGMKAVKVLGEFDANASGNISRRDFSFDGDSSVNKSKDSTTAKDRVREWEREKERLREMERLSEIERERDEMYKREKKHRQAVLTSKENGEGSQRKESLQQEERARTSEERREKRNASIKQIKIPRPGSSAANREKKNSDWDKENIASSATSPVLPMFKLTSPLTNCEVLFLFNRNGDIDFDSSNEAILHIGRDTPSSTTKETKQSSSRFKHSIKASIGEFLIAKSPDHRCCLPSRGFE